MMRELGFAVNPVLVIDAKTSEHILHRRGIGQMKHIDVTHLWLQDVVTSNRLQVRRVQSGDNLAGTGTKALSNKIVRNRATPMGYVDAPREFEVRRCHGVFGLANQSE